MGEVDGIGEAVVGAMLAAAVEPVAGGDSSNGNGACLNCGTPLAGPYCSACGQKAQVHRSLATFFHDLIAGLFNFEGKIWRTLPMLAFKPGEMTRRYVEGERARFVSPVALYLFSVFAMFAVLNFTGAIDPATNAMRNDLERALQDERAGLRNLEVQRQAVQAKKVDTAALDRRIASAREDLAQIERMRRRDIVAFDGTEREQAPQWVRRTVAKVQADPQAFVLKLQDAASKFSWMLIPLSVPFLWLLFPFNRRIHLFDHTVFVTYSLSFMMMLVIAGGLLVSAGLPGVASLLIFVPPVHMYRQLRGAYRLGRISALLRTLLLVSFAMIAAGLFFVAVFAIGIL